MMIDKILQYCADKNEERGGVVYDGEFVPLQNIAQDKKNNFEFDINDLDYDKIEMIVHSHIDGNPYLSSADRFMQVKTGKPWMVVCDGKAHTYSCMDLLRGRDFIYGHHDCATIIEDAHALMGINFEKIERGSLESDHQNNKLLDSLPLLGFERVYDPHPGCVLLTSSGHNPDHLMMVIDDSRVLHHAYGQLSRLSIYGSVVRGMTHSIWRHKDLSSEAMEAVLFDIGASDIWQS